MSVKTGIKGRAEIIVAPEHTAKAVGSGALEVLATPMMAALMEQAAWTSIQPELEEGQGSVGTALILSHDAPTPVGMKVWAESEVVGVEGRNIAFSINVYDESGLVGSCAHQRAIIDNEKFFTRCQNKWNH